MNIKRIIATASTVAVALSMLIGGVAVLLLSGEIVFCASEACSSQSLASFELPSLDPIILWSILIGGSLIIVLIVLIIVVLARTALRRKSRVKRRTQKNEEELADLFAQFEEDELGFTPISSVGEIDEMAQVAHSFSAEEQQTEFRQTSGTNELIIAVYENELERLRLRAAEQKKCSDYAALDETTARIAEYENKIDSLRSENGVPFAKLVGATSGSEGAEGVAVSQNADLLTEYIRDVDLAVAEYKEICEKIPELVDKQKRAKAKANALQDALIHSSNPDAINSYSASLSKLYSLISKYEKDLSVLKSKKAHTFAGLKSKRNVVNGFISANNVQLDTIILIENQILSEMENAERCESGETPEESESGKETKTNLAFFDAKIAELDERTKTANDDKKLDCMLEMLDIMQRAQDCRTKSCEQQSRLRLGLVSREQMRLRDAR